MTAPAGLGAAVDVVDGEVGDEGVVDGGAVVDSAGARRLGERVTLDVDGVFAPPTARPTPAATPAPARAAMAVAPAAAPPSTNTLRSTASLRRYSDFVGLGSRKGQPPASQSDRRRAVQRPSS